MINVTKKVTNKATARKPAMHKPMVISDKKKEAIRRMCREHKNRVEC